MSDPPLSRILVMGTSSGGLQALTTIMGCLPGDFSLPLLVLQHVGYQSDDFLARYLDERCALRVSEAHDGQTAEAGHAYIAPADYHLLINDDFSLSLSSTEKVNFARPSIDVLFESAAYAFGAAVFAVLLTGANSDGSRGLATIKSYGGRTLVQDPQTAYAPTMPRSAIKLGVADSVLPLPQIGPYLKRLFGPPN